MKCIVISDNHYNKQALVDVFDYYKGRGYKIFHCGDSELSSTDPIWQGVENVIGNVDYDNGFPDEVVTQVNGVTIFMVHGHRHSVNFRLDDLVEDAKRHGASIALYGHTHRLDSQVQDGVLCLNPGSISVPRGTYRDTPTYVLMDVTPDLVRVDFYTKKHEKLEELSTTNKPTM